MNEKSEAVIGPDDKTNHMEMDGTKNDQFQKSAPVDLLQWKDMPKHLQFNPYVHTGYRPLTNAWGCLSSLFCYHNETVNILTHGIPVIYILATVPNLMPWTDFRFLSWCHLIGSLAPWCGSFLYHLFMNLDRGGVVYYRLLKLDMFGIWMSQSFGAVTFVTATGFCWKIKSILILGCVLCLYGLYKALLASSPWQRRLCFLFPFVMRVHLVVLRMFKLAGGNTESMVHVYLQDGVSIIGGAIGAEHLPEKWCPGSVDFYLNSHNIMHVLVVVAVYSMHQVDQYLYDPILLNSLDFRKTPAILKPYITAADPGEPWMIVRPLRESDFDKGFLQLLDQLTAVGNVSRLEFLRKFAQMKGKGDYFVTVIEDTRKQLIIGAATLVIEHKFIHDCGLKARLEDVVVNDTYRGKQLGKLYVLEPGNSNMMQIRYDTVNKNTNGSHNTNSS